MPNVFFSSQTNDWHTPNELFDSLNAEFGFETDLAATAENTKCKKFFTIEDNALEQVWRGVCFLNPPYGREIKHFVKKAWESSRGGATVVLLIPARTDTSYWHNYIFGKASEIRFLPGRVKFVRGSDGHSAPAPFPSAVVIFRGASV
jgi:phage N-6-adenine-methyltransferase